MGVRITKRRKVNFGSLTILDIISAFAQFGPLDYQLVKKAMGTNWPPEWDRLGPGEGIFASETTEESSKD